MADGQGVRLEPALQLIFARMHVFTVSPVFYFVFPSEGIGADSV